MKKLVSLILVLSLVLTAQAALAISGGDDQLLPGVNTNVPNMMFKNYEDVNVEVVPFKDLESGEQVSMIICTPPENACEDPASRPCIVLTRGSGFRAVVTEDYLGKENDQQMLRALMFAKMGYVAAAVEFRGYTTEPEGSGSFPAALQDVRGGVRFLKANAEKYGIDIERMGVIGQSSGGYQSAMLAITNGAWAVEVINDGKDGELGESYFTEADADAAIAEGKDVVKLDTAAFDIDPNAANFNSAVIASVDLYGIAKVDEIGGLEAQHTLADNTAQEEVKFMTGRDDIEIWDVPYVHTAANPFCYYDETDVNDLTMLFIHGTADTRVYPYATESFFANNKQNNVTSYRFLIPDAGHGGPRWAQDDTLTLYLDFFGETLRGETGHRAIVFPAEGGTLSVALNGEDVTATPWKLYNVTSEDSIVVTAVPDEGYSFSGLVTESVGDDYVVKTVTVYEGSVELTGDCCYNVTAVFTPVA